MADPTEPSPLAAKTLQRLQKLADGNGLKPDAIHLYSSEENTYTIEGTMTLLPLFETHSLRHGGGPSSQCSRTVGSSGELKNEIDRLKRDFESKPKWITEAMDQLKGQLAGGWGLDDVMIKLPDQSIVIGASETCSSCHGSRQMTCGQCHGEGHITCPHCQGQRQEICHVCLGSGQNPALPNQTCINCNGMRYTHCRYCNGGGNLNCPTCHGSRGTTCSACGGAGIFTEEVSITCGARTQFKITSQGLPSGLRRGLDRLGTANLAKGHADIESLPPTVEEEEEQVVTPPIAGARQPEAKKTKAPKPEVLYRAQLPYADLRMNFLGKKVIVGVFGKKSVLLGVPPFLDMGLEPVREKLKLVAKGSADIDEILKIRVMRDALMLQISGNNQVVALRKIYPHGLTQNVAAEILRNMRLALNKLTLRSRSLAAVLCALAGSGVFAGTLFTPLFADATQNLKAQAGLGASAAFLFIVMAACWFTLSAATRVALQRRFPKIAIPIAQHTGKTGYGMLAVLFMAFVAMLLITPNQPAWLLPLLGKTPLP